MQVRIDKRCLPSPELGGSLQGMRHEEDDHAPIAPPDTPHVSRAGTTATLSAEEAGEEMAQAVGVELDEAARHVRAPMELGAAEFECQDGTALKYPEMLVGCEVRRRRRRR